MKKSILFKVNGNKAWIGGVYYRRNVIFSVLQNNELMEEYNIIIYCLNSFKEEFSVFEKAAIVISYDKFDKEQWYSILYNYNVKYFFALEALDIQRMMGINGSNWIPDFQHCILPQFFSDDEINSRNYSFSKWINSKQPLFLSSYAAYEDMKKYFGDKNNVYILHFVAYIENEISLLCDKYMDKVCEKYKLTDKNIILISNQFWQHKNHKIVFEAIGKLSKKGTIDDNVVFTFTGNLQDYRNPDYYNQLLQLVNDSHIKPYINILGYIDRLEQLAIMKKSKFVIQPSLFEGWGITLEECKVLDKRVILSDIPVHREQMNDNCLLFNPSDCDELCDCIERFMCTQYESNINKGIAQMYLDAREYSKAFKEMIYNN